MNVYCASSCSFFQSCVLYADTFCMGLLCLVTRLEACSDASEMEEASAAVLPMSVIFLSAIALIERPGSLKGGLSRPSLEIMSFWLEGGTERESAISSERSDIVASEGKEKV